MALSRSLPPVSLLRCLPCVERFRLLCTAATLGTFGAGVRRDKKCVRDGGGRGRGVMWGFWERVYLLGARSKATNVLMIDGKNEILCKNCIY